MKLVVDSAEFQRALQLCSIATRKRDGVIPILANARLLAVGDGLSLAATDLELTIIARTSAVVREPGAVTCELKALQDIAKSITGPIAMELLPGKLDIRADSAKWSIPTLPAEDYPTLPDLGEARSVTFSASELLPMLRTVAYAKTDNDNRFTLNGVYISMESDRIEMVATDGHRMALCEMRARYERASALLLPAKLVSASDKLGVELGAVEVTISWSDSHVSIELGNTIMIGRREDAQFPNYKSFNSSGPTLFRVPAAALRTCLARAIPFAIESSNALRVDLRSGLLLLRSENVARGQFGDELAVDYSGEEISLVCNGRYLTEALAVIYTPMIEIACGNSRAPITIRPVDSDLAFTAAHIVAPMEL